MFEVKVGRNKKVRGVKNDIQDDIQETPSERTWLGQVEYKEQLRSKSSHRLSLFLGTARSMRLICVSYLGLKAKTAAQPCYS